MDTDNTDIMTPTEITRVLANDETRIDQTGRTLATARSHYERLTLRGNYFTDEAHVASFNEHLPALEAAETAAIRAAEVAERNARLVLAQTRSAGVTLAPEEFAAAEARRSFIAEDAERLTLAEIRDAVARAIAVGDRPLMYLWLRAGRARLRANAEGRLPERGDEQARADLPRLFGQIGDQLRDTRLDGATKRADAALERALAAAKTAGTRRREDEQRRYREQHYPGFVAWPTDR